MSVDSNGTFLREIYNTSWKVAAGVPGIATQSKEEKRMQGTRSGSGRQREHRKRKQPCCVVATVSRRSESPRLFTRVQEPLPDQLSWSLAATAYCSTGPTRSPSGSRCPCCALTGSLQPVTGPDSLVASIIQIIQSSP